MKPNPIIWILWGMWPYASLRAYKILLDISKSFSDWRANHDFPHILLDNIPVRALIDGPTNESQTVSQVRSENMRLIEAWANIILMACNTMHLYSDTIYNNYEKNDICFLSLVWETQKYIQSLWYKKIWILWSERTLNSELYKEGFHQSGIDTYVPEREQRKILNHIIDTVIGWENLQSDDIASILIMIKSCRDAWCESILLACTELPIACIWIDSSIPLFDPLEITLRKACELYYGKHSFAFP